MKKILFASLVVLSCVANAQDVKKDEIAKEVVRVMDSVNSNSFNVSLLLRK